jgi:ABC-type multidrug transport system ATPase subunit
MLTLKNLSKTYKKQIVFRDLTHDFGTGVTIITGPSGVGKSTLLRLCATVEKPSSGELLWQGRSIQKNKRAFRAGLGYAPQQIDFPDDITANEFMAHIGALKGQSYSETMAQTESLLLRLGLRAEGDKKLQAFSGGMKRRLGIAQAFLGSPQCLILDEPTAELDPMSAKNVHDIVFDFAQNATVIMTTHLAESLKDYSYAQLVLGDS